MQRAQVSVRKGATFLLRYAVVGCGYWGPNLIRNLHGLEQATITWACDLDTSRLDRMRKTYPGVHYTTRYQDVLEADDVDVVAIATPTNSHYQLGMAALTSGKHIFVEKPIASSVAEGRALVDAAKAKGLRVGVDHTYLFGGPVRKIKELLDREELGNLYYIDSIRVNLGLFQSDINVLWDLAPHDLSIIDYLLSGACPMAVSALGAAHVGEQENVVYLTLRYESGLVAHVNVNWLAPVKIRQMLIGGSKKMIVYNDVIASEKIQIFDRGADTVHSKEDMYGALVQYRMGDMLAPRISNDEALSVELREFTDCVEKGLPFVSDGNCGLRVLAVLEAAERSLRANGVPVNLIPVAAG